MKLGITCCPMRRTTVLLLSLVVACSSAGELAPTITSRPSTTPSTTTSTTTGSPVASTSTTAETTIPLAPLTAMAYEEVAELGFPIHMVAWILGFSAIATKDGRIWLFDGTNVSETPVLDIREQVRDDGERGLLAIAVHPDDTDRFFIHYSASDGDTVVAEFTWDNESLGNERVLLRLDQPAGYHNGGMIQFGPDKSLYLGLGDGGGGGDRFNNGQNRETLLGGLVRIDVETGATELFQYGLRNPWRFWIDASTIYIADVGQGAFEEISVSQLEPDVNYGWPITEGLHCFSPSSGCDTRGLTLPIVEVSHKDASSCSITGGVMYHGEKIPELSGTFLFSDYCAGYLRGLSDGEVTDYTDQVGVPGRIASFGVDGSGEVYVMTTDRILKLVPERG